MLNKNYNIRQETNTAVYKETNFNVKHDASGKIRRKEEQTLFISVSKDSKSFGTLNRLEPYYIIRVSKKREPIEHTGFPDWGGTRSYLKKVFVKVIQILVVGDIYTFELEVLEVGDEEYESIDEHKIGECII